MIWLVRYCRVVIWQRERAREQRTIDDEHKYSNQCQLKSQPWRGGRKKRWKNSFVATEKNRMIEKTERNVSREWKKSIRQNIKYEDFPTLNTLVTQNWMGVIIDVDNPTDWVHNLVLNEKYNGEWAHFWALLDAILSTVNAHRKS